MSVDSSSDQKQDESAAVESDPTGRYIRVFCSCFDFIFLYVYILHFFNCLIFFFSYFYDFAVRRGVRQGCIQDCVSFALIFLLLNMDMVL